LVMVAVWRVYMIVVLRNIFGRLVLAHGEVLHSGLRALLLGQWHCACFGWLNSSASAAVHSSLGRAVCSGKAVTYISACMLV
jgi:hypothetical protein